VSAAEDRLYGLMEIAEQQQAAVQRALDGLSAERAALARERERLAREIALIGQGTIKAAKEAVAAGFAGMGVEGVTAVRVATAPLLDRPEGMMADAASTEKALRRVVPGRAGGFWDALSH
jgi:hypothetical protein